MSKKYNQYLGKAGHLFIMSEFLIRGWNVAIPEVDTGDDIFVVEDQNTVFRRVQVKTSQVTQRQKSRSMQFQLPVKQLKTISPTLLHYIFLGRFTETWTKPIIIRQDVLYDYYANHQIGNLHQESLVLYFSWQENQVICSGQDFTPYINDYRDFPVIQH